MANEDGLGPSAVVALRDPRAGQRAVVVIDNVACGPAIGGVRVSADIGADEVAALARAMTLKNAMARLPHGGGKAGICAPPDLPRSRMEHVLRWFARAIRDLVQYIPGPDMGTDETAMAWVHDEIGRAVGLPRVLGGIPLDEIGATGRGLAAAGRSLQAAGAVELPSARVVIAGFGAVGKHAARFLAAEGATIVGVSDSRGATVDADGLELDRLFELKDEGRSVADLSTGTPLARDELLCYPCDILIPAARSDVLHEHNAGAVKARVVLEGANIPTTPEAERILHDRGVVVLPDFVVNAGGVICAATERRGGTEADALSRIDELVAANTRVVLEHALRDRVRPRVAAGRIARQRLDEASTYRREYGS